MKFINILIIAFIVVFNSSCKTENRQNQSVKKTDYQPCELTEFVGSDTAGVYTGKVIKFSEKREISVHRHLSVKSLNDTIIFKVPLESTNIPTANVVESKLKPGMCVTIHYETDIVLIEGIEANRFYYARRLEYP